MSPIQTHEPESKIVHVVDDDLSLRRSLGRILTASGYDARLYASAGEFALCPRADLRGCLLLDVRMPGPSGLDLQRSLLLSEQAIPVIFLTGYEDVRTSVNALKAGAVDFLLKPVEQNELLAAVNKALALELTLRQRRIRTRNLRSCFEALTPREREVFQRVTAGQPNKQIAYETAIGERTVKAHRAKVMGKMGATSLAELVHIADELRGV